MRRPPAPDAPGADPAVDHAGATEQARMVFDRSRVSNLFGIPVSAMFCALLWGHVATGWLLAWFAARTAVTLWRVALTRRYDRSPADAVVALGRRFESALAVDGLLWAMPASLLMPDDPPELRATLVAAVVGIAAVGLVVMTMSLRASVALVVPLILPPALTQFLAGDAVGLFTGLGMLVFLALVVVEGRHAADHTRAMLRLRFRMDAVTEQLREALESSRHSGEVKTRFLATMSHEMRTPLHGILGLARLLRREPDGPAAERLERLATLERAGEHLLGVINDILDHSRIESGRQPVAPSGPFDLVALLESVTAIARGAAGEKGLVVALEPPAAGACWVLGDAPRLRQVLVNLLGNAVKFTPAGRIDVHHARDADGRTVIEVRDTGPGVPSALAERIFEPFVQGDDSLSRAHGGTGLGLTISRELAHALGGTLVCVPRDGLSGAVFRLTLNLPAAPAGVAEPETPDAGPLKARVLVVEDNPVSAIVVEAMARRLGLEATLLSDGEAAVQAAAHGTFDIVFMDWHMPRMDGFEATARIRRHEAENGRPRSCIVALTANAMPGDRERSLAGGMDDHLPKPFDEDTLRAVVARHLRPQKAAA